MIICVQATSSCCINTNLGLGTNGRINEVSMPETDKKSVNLGRRTSSVELADHLASGTGGSVPAGEPSSYANRSVDEVRRALEEAQVRLLTALDAVAGAEAQSGAAQARVRELELEQHMLEVERDQLRREVERLSTQRRRGRPLGLARSLARRILA